MKSTLLYSVALLAVVNGLSAQPNSGVIHSQVQLTESCIHGQPDPGGNPLFDGTAACIFWDWNNNGPDPGDPIIPIDPDTGYVNINCISTSESGTFSAELTIQRQPPAGSRLYVRIIAQHTIYSSAPFVLPATPFDIEVTGWSCSPDDPPQSSEPGKIVGRSLVLHPCCPNPFNSSTRLTYDLPRAATVCLSVFDLSGRAVTTLESGWKSAGSHQFTFTARDLPSGVYFIRLSTGQIMTQTKVLLLK